MKFVITSRRVSVAILIGEQPEEDEDGEMVSNTGGDFEVAGCSCDREDEVEDGFGFSPVRC